MSRVALADVLWDAANKHLHAVDGQSSIWGGTKCIWSCNAFAISAGFGNSDHLSQECRDLLLSLGCNSASSVLQESEQSAEARQGVRYMWLLLAMHVAEDEGIEIERGAA